MEEHNSHIYNTCLSPLKTWVATERVGHAPASVITYSRTLLRVRDDTINYVRTGLNRGCTGQSGIHSHFSVRACVEYFLQYGSWGDDMAVT